MFTHHYTFWACYAMFCAGVVLKIVLRLVRDKVQGQDPKIQLYLVRIMEPEDQPRRKP